MPPHPYRTGRLGVADGGGHSLGRGVPAADAGKQRGVLADALTDHDEAAMYARELFAAGGVRAVQSAGFLCGWRGWGIDRESRYLASTTFNHFLWRGLFVRAVDEPARYGSGPGIHAITIRLQSWSHDPEGENGAWYVSYPNAIICHIAGFIAGWGETWNYKRGFRCRFATIVGVLGNARYIRLGHLGEAGLVVIRTERPDHLNVPRISPTQFVAETRRLGPPENLTH